MVLVIRGCRAVDGRYDRPVVRLAAPGGPGFFARPHRSDPRDRLVCVGVPGAGDDRSRLAPRRAPAIAGAARAPLGRRWIDVRGIPLADRSYRRAPARG